MLRILVLLLLLANLGFAGWTQGWLDNLVGIRARGDREPERLARQVRPQAVVIVAPPAATSATGVAGGQATSAVPGGAPGAAVGNPAASAVTAGTTAAAAVPACLEAGPFDPVQVVAAEAALRSLEPPLPAGTWTDEKTERPGGWLVYMGRYAGAAPLEKKEEELKRRNLDYEEVHLPGLEPGLSLGRFDDRPAAAEALADFARLGIRTARVVKAGEATVSHRLRIAQAEPALANRLAGLQGGTALGGGFLPCATTAGN